jgi:hypothetical protein
MTKFNVFTEKVQCLWWSFDKLGAGWTWLTDQIKTCQMLLTNIEDSQHTVTRPHVFFAPHEIFHYFYFFIIWPFFVSHIVFLSKVLHSSCFIDKIIENFNEIFNWSHQFTTDQILYNKILSGMVACFAGERYYGKCFYIICCLKSFTPRNEMYFSFITVADFQSSEKIINNEKFRHGIFFYVWIRESW